MEEQQFNEQEQAPMYQMPNQFAPTSLIKTTSEVDELLFVTKCNMLGQEKIVDKEGNISWSKPNKEKQLLNEAGILVLLAELESRLSNIFVFSNFDEDKIEKLCKGYAKVNGDLIFEHWDQWGIQSHSKASLITGKLHDTYLSTLLKAKFGGTMKCLTTTLRTSEHSNVQPQQMQQQDNKGMLKKIFDKITPGD